MFQFELHPHTGEIRTEILVNEKDGVIKHVKHQQFTKLSFFICEKMDLLTMWNRVKYFITDCSTSCMSVLLSDTRFGISLWHYSFRSYKCVIQHCHTFGLWSHHVRLGAGGFRQKLPLDGATELLSKIWQHITTVRFVSAFIVVFSRKP